VAFCNVPGDRPARLVQMLQRLRRAARQRPVDELAGEPSKLYRQSVYVQLLVIKRGLLTHGSLLRPSIVTTSQDVAQIRTSNHETRPSTSTSTSTSASPPAHRRQRSPTVNLETALELPRARSRLGATAGGTPRRG